ncbi:sigma-70 family RNA polymerase sigma factor [Nocardioides sp. GY 10127]|uniref:sigma-70 family RNA polymerase sigma factor n=1 Tax=Nocardioides sp. GY 10127 TaxID=2569762 RepID=UPI0010A8DA43|nr:sigma-70 family RNA polymerase sigma factor [Nocardioides sp. GY 10127]TIC79343.1 sigma-70 family RNA polymerase sigma factor [Nocardioides sp. GY 10127]
MDDSCGPAPGGAPPDRAERTALLLAEWHGLTDDHDTPDGRETRAEVVHLHMPLARSLARHYGGRGVATDDLEQVAYLALVHSVDRFDVRTGVPFVAFAVPTIRGELRRHFRDNSWTIRPPRAVQDARWRLMRSGLSFDRVTSLEVEDAAHALDVSEGTVTDAMTAGSAFHADSLDAPAPRGAAEDGPAEGTGRDLAGTRDETADLVDRLALETEVGRLGTDDQDLLVMRFVEERTQAQIGVALGVSQVQVSRRLNQVLGRLRSRLDDAFGADSLGLPDVPGSGAA